MAEFEQQTMVVTGASEGIGRAFCLEAAKQRPRLVLAARNAERMASLKREAAARGARALAVPTDVTDETACRALIGAAVEEFGGIDVLVNNAGGTMWAQLDEMEDLSIFEHLMRLNYLSAVYCTFYALPHLKARRGRLVGVSSMAGLNGVPSRSAYAASKHAMFGFFDSLRIELAPHGVSVTMVAPDFVVSEIHKRAIGADGTPLGKSPMQESRIMTGAECAQVMVRGMERRKRLVLTSRRGKVGRWLKLLAPGLVDRIAARAIRDRR